MKIAVLSFGALLKTGSKLVKSKWSNKTAPSLPIELCRVSKSGKLVLAISEERGVQNSVYHATAKGTDLSKFVPQFLKAENIGDSQICILDLANRSASTKANKYPNISRPIAQWAKKAGYDAVVFNGLGIKFKHAIDIPFSVENAVKYVKGLKGAAKKAQLAYLKNIPASIKTPVLSLLQGKK